MSQMILPQGMRDLLKEECERKTEMRNTIEAVFCKYGYEPIETPTVEMYETYRNALGSFKDAEMYKFFDANGEILTLRLDMTVPIARVCATRFPHQEPPFRFRYCADVFKVSGAFAGKRSEITDCGIELIGPDSSADIEVLKCALEVMDALGFHYQLEIGNSSFFLKACELFHLKDAEVTKLADLVDRKSLVELNEYLEELKLNEEGVRFFTTLPMLAGKDALQETQAIAFDESLRKEVKELQKIEQDLQALGYGDRISFDLGKVPHLNYYTGLIFEGYVDGIGSVVLSGGRYDSLLQKFGRDLPACGFSLKLDTLLDAQEETL